MIYRSALKASDFHPDTQSFFKGRIVAVLGGAGFIGSHIVEALLDMGVKPVVVTRSGHAPFLDHLRDQITFRTADLAELEPTRAALKDIPVILNLAAKVAGLSYNAAHPASIFDANLRLFMNVMRVAAEQKCGRVLITSSACVYPRHCSVPTPESEGFKDEPEPTNAGYGWAKRMEEFLGQSYASEYGLSVAIARPYNAYGPRDNFDPVSSHVLPALILKALQSAKKGETVFPVWGDGSHSRSFLYVDDFARGLIETAARFSAATPINIGAAEETTIRQAAELIAQKVSTATGYSIKPQFDPQGLTGQPRRAPDTEMAQDKLGYVAKVNLATGLGNTIDWYIQQQASHL